MTKKTRRRIIKKGYLAKQPRKKYYQLSLHPSEILRKLLQNNPLRDPFQTHYVNPILNLDSGVNYRRIIANKLRNDLSQVGKDIQTTGNQVLSGVKRLARNLFYSGPDLKPGESYTTDDGKITITVEPEAEEDDMTPSPNPSSKDAGDFYDRMSTVEVTPLPVDSGSATLPPKAVKEMVEQIQQQIPEGADRLNAHMMASKDNQRKLKAAQVQQEMEKEDSEKAKLQELLQGSTMALQGLLRGKAGKRKADESIYLTPEEMATLYTNRINDTDPGYVEDGVILTPFEVQKFLAANEARSGHPIVYRHKYDNMQDGIYVLNPDTRVIKPLMGYEQLPRDGKIFVLKQEAAQGFYPV